jgi:hypothetical protein
MATEKKYGQDLHLEGRYKIKDATDLQIKTLDEEPTWLEATKSSVLSHIRKLVILAKAMNLGTSAVGTIVGQTGATGATGLTGTTGISGAVVTGLIGATGGTSTTGATGMTGITSDTGGTGVTGSTSTTGVTGPTGQTGIGVTGETGGIGDTGATGLTGTTGYTLVTGVVGAVGLTGSTGKTGLTGAAGIVLAEDAKTTSLEENIDGLSSCITLANDLKVKLNAHYTDAGVTGEEHIALDGIVTTNNATNLITLKTLLNALTASYHDHDGDAELASDWVYHQAQESGDASLTSIAAVTTLAGCITRANDIKAKLNTHMADATSHTDGDSPQVATGNATNGASILVTTTGSIPGDRIFWSITDTGTYEIYGISAIVGTDTTTFSFSGNPGADTIISYAIFRP